MAYVNYNTLFDTFLCPKTPKNQYMYEVEII